MADGKRVVEIRDAFFEYGATFAQPKLDINESRAIHAVFTALQKWKLEPSAVVQNRGPNLGDSNTVFNLLGYGVSIQLYVAAIRFIAVNPDWSRATEILEIFNESYLAIKDSVSPTFLRQDVSLAMHLVPDAWKGKDVLSRLIKLSPQLESVDTTAYGLTVYKADSTLLLDASRLYQDGIFLRLMRNFPIGTSFKDIAASMYHDETKALDLLGFRLQ